MLLGTLGTQTLHRQIDFLEAVAGRQGPILPGVQLIKANHLGAARTLEVSMLMWMHINVGTKTPYPVVACHLMRQAFFIQPFKHAVERDPVQLQPAKQTLLNFMMRDGLLFSQQNGKNSNPAWRHPTAATPDDFFCLPLEINRHKGIQISPPYLIVQNSEFLGALINYLCNKVAFTIDG